MSADTRNGINLWIIIIGVALMPLVNGNLHRIGLHDTTPRLLVVGGVAMMVGLLASLLPRRYPASSWARLGMVVMAFLAGMGGAVVDKWIS
jgi:hypothetical protein